jgi:non-ribosomal peptide synthetase component F
VPDHLLPAAFAAQARRTPDAPAILTSNRSLSYRDFYQRSATAAAWLRACGAGRDELVGLLIRRGPEQVVGIMAALMAGGAYLPVDAALPSERGALHAGPRRGPRRPYERGLAASGRASKKGNP